MDTRHPDEGTIHTYVERQLSQTEHARVEAHVSSCAECAASVAEARGVIAAASRIVSALDGVPANVIPTRRARRLPPWLAAAAVMVLAVGVSSVAVRSGLDSRRSGSAVAADAVGEPRQQAVSESQASVATEPAVIERGAVMSGEMAATGGALAAQGEGVESRRETAAVAPDPLQRKGVREDVAVLRVPTGAAQPSAPPAAQNAEVGFSGTDGGAAGDVRAMGAAVQPARVAARAPAAVPVDAPADAAAPSLRQSQATITGRVMSMDGEPLAGANVFINEFNVSVGTDTAGRYALTIPSDRLDGQAATVRARAIGYAPQTQELKVTDGQTADFELRPERTQLSGVVVTGGTTVRGDGPMRTIRYEAAPGVILELREFHAAARVPPAGQGVNEYRWSDAAGTRHYVLSGSLPAAELKQLAGRLGELRVVR